MGFWRMAWVALGVALASSHAFAYTVVRPLSDDVRLSIESSKRARIEHTLSLRIMGGPFKGFEVGGFEDDVTFDPAAVFVHEDGSESRATVQVAPPPKREVELRQAQPGHGVRAAFSVDDAHGLRHGLYTLRFRYDVDLEKSGAVESSGALTRLSWWSPTFSEGLDPVRVTFQLPASATEPRLDGNDGESVSSTLHRRQGRDEIELVRPHVTKGEGARWAIRVDPGVFGVSHVSAPAAPSPPRRAMLDQIAPWLAWAIALACGLVFGLAVRKQRRSTDAHPLWPSAWMPFAAGALCALGTGLSWSLPAVGALLFVMTMGITLRIPRPDERVRGPGDWFPVRDGDALPSKGSVGAAWRAIPLGMMVCLLILGTVGYRVDPASPYVALLAMSPWAALLRRASPSAARHVLLRGMIRVLRRDASLRATWWGRLPSGSDTFDELRVLTAPRHPMPGFFGVEIAVVTRCTWLDTFALPCLLVRVRENSHAAERVAKLFPHAAFAPGRKPHERVFQVTAAEASAVVRAAQEVAHDLAERRVATIRYRGTDRRSHPTMMAAA